MRAGGGVVDGLEVGEQRYQRGLGGRGDFGGVVAAAAVAVAGTGRGIAVGGRGRPLFATTTT